MPVIIMPDGTEIEFPDTMSQQEIQGVLQKQFPPTQAQAQPQVPSIPEMVGKGMLDTLPYAGGVAGTFLGGPPGGMLGAGIGYLGRGAARSLMGNVPPQLGQGQETAVTGQGAEGFAPLYPEEVTQPVGQNLMGATKEGMLWGVAGPVGEKVIAPSLNLLRSPFQKSMAARMAQQPAVAAAQQLVEKEGARISPSEISGSPVAGFFERMAERLWPASKHMQKSRENLQPIVEKLKEEMIQARQLYGDPKAVDAAWENWVLKAGGPKAQYEMPETTRLIQDALNKPVGKFGMFWKQYAPAFLSGKTAKELTQAEIGTAQAEIAGINKTLETMAASGQPSDMFLQVKRDMLAKKLTEGVGGETYSVQAIRDLLNTLKPMSGQGAQRTIRMQIGDAITNDLRKSGNEEMIEALSNARQASRMEKIALPLKNIFSQSMTNPQSLGEMPSFNPASFVQKWRDARARFIKNKDYSEEDIRVIDKFADKMRAMQGDLAKAREYKTPDWQSMGSYTRSPLGALAATIKYPVMAVPMAADWGLALSLMSPNGIMRKFLTTGWRPPTLSSQAAAMRGLEKVFEEERND